MNLPLYPMFVGGERVSSRSGATFEVESPATGEAIALIAEGDERGIDGAVSTAEAAFADWGATTGEERARVLSAAAHGLHATHQFGSTVRRQTGIVMDVDSALRGLAKVLSTSASSVWPEWATCWDFTPRAASDQLESLWRSNWSDKAALSY